MVAVSPTHVLPRHFEASAFVPAGLAEVFDHLDDHKRLSAHMSRSSWMMGGGRMQLSFDDQAGRRIGSTIGLSGSVLGIALSVQEVITVREPPYRKTWETIGTPRLLVIDHYRLGFDITPRDGGSMVRVFIDYALPQKGVAWLCGVLLGDYYAKWCARQMLTDVSAAFASSSTRNEGRR